MEQVRHASVPEANELATVVFLNKGELQFEKKLLPAAAQMTSFYAIDTVDVNKDGHIDLLLAGNFYEAKPEVGIYDGSYGLLLLGNGQGEFRAMGAAESGLIIRGAVRDMLWIKEGSADRLLLARNNQPLQLWTLHPK